MERQFLCSDVEIIIRYLQSDTKFCDFHSVVIQLVEPGILDELAKSFTLKDITRGAPINICEVIPGPNVANRNVRINVIDKGPKAKPGMAWIDILLPTETDGTSLNTLHGSCRYIMSMLKGYRASDHRFISNKKRRMMQQIRCYCKKGRIHKPNA